MLEPGVAVAVDHPEADETPGVVVDARVDGPSGSQQSRVVVASRAGGGRVEIDTAADRVRELEGREATLVKGVVDSE